MSIVILSWQLDNVSHCQVFAFLFYLAAVRDFFSFPSISLMKLEIKILGFVSFLQHPVSNTLHPRTPLCLSTGPSVWT